MADNGEQKEAVAGQIHLPSGAIATKNKLKGRDFTKFQSIAVKQPAEATQWLIVRSFKINGEPLTIDQFDELDFEDVAVLSGEVNKTFLPYLPGKTS